jgi:hypothetical protein
MSVEKGDILELLVTFVSGDACWGTSGNLTGFVHHTGWSEEPPIPESAVPVEGQTLTVKVIHVVQACERLPKWSTFDVKFKVDPVALVVWPHQIHVERELFVAMVEVGTKLRVDPWCFGKYLRPTSTLADLVKPFAEAPRSSKKI